MAWVEVQRVAGGQSKHLNPFEIEIDAEIVGRLGPGESGIFEVTPGPHELSAKIYWCRSEKVAIDLRGDQRLTFCCDTRAKSFLTDGYWASFGYRRYLRLSQVASETVRAVDYRGRQAGHSISSPETTDANRGKVVVSKTDRSPPLAAVLNLISDRQPAVTAFLLLAVAILLFVLTLEFNFLGSVSVIYIGVQAVYAINFHLLAPRFAFGPGIKSHEPFQFRIVQEATISAAFALAGVLSFSGVLQVGKFVGWLAIGAACAGAANVVVSRLRLDTAGGSNQPPKPSGK
jgi:hypothetical protein